MRFRQRARCVSLRALPLQRAQRGRVRIHCSASRTAAALARFTSGLLAAIMFENVACPGATHHYSTRAKGNQHYNAGGKSCRNPRRVISAVVQHPPEREEERGGGSARRQHVTGGGWHPRTRRRAIVCCLSSHAARARSSGECFIE